MGTIIPLSAPPTPYLNFISMVTTLGYEISHFTEPLRTSHKSVQEPSENRLPTPHYNSNARTNEARTNTSP